MKIGIIVAMNSEYRLVESIMSSKKKIQHPNIDISTGIIGDKEVILLQSGIGKVFASISTVELIKEFSPDLIINTGVAGGIDDKVRVMDIVVGENIVYHDFWCGPGYEYGQIEGMPKYLSSDKKIVEISKQIDTDINVHYGLICSGDMFITAPQQLKAIKLRFNEGLAVEMESAAIAHVAKVYGIPFFGIRIISDTPGIDNHYEQYDDFWTKAPEVSFQYLQKLLSII